MDENKRLFEYIPLEQALMCSCCYLRIYRIVVFRWYLASFGRLWWGGKYLLFAATLYGIIFSGKLSGKLSGMAFAFEKPYLLTRASLQDDVS